MPTRSSVETSSYGVHTNPIRSHLVPLRPQTEVWGYTIKVHLRGLNPEDKLLRI